jgi:hypothetical protein
MEIVDTVRQNGWFSEGQDALGRVAAPLELKILAVLRVFGRGDCFDTVAEITRISEGVLRTFFHKFCRLFSERYFHEICHPPNSDEELAEVTSVYEQHGLPGCIGSTDCVHIRYCFMLIVCICFYVIVCTSMTDGKIVQPEKEASTRERPVSPLCHMK